MSVLLHLPPPVLSKFLAEHITGQFRLLILVAPCWMEAPWLPTVLSIAEDIPHQCLIGKDLIMAVLGSWVLKGLQSLHLTLFLLRDVCCTKVPFLGLSSGSISAPKLAGILVQLVFSFLLFQSF